MLKFQHNTLLAWGLFREYVLKFHIWYGRIYLSHAVMYYHACIGECDCQARVRQGPVGWAVPVHHATLPEPGACAEGGERVLSWSPWLQACDLVPPLQVGLLLLSSLMESATVQVGSEKNLVMRWIYSVFPRKGGSQKYDCIKELNEFQWPYQKGY